MQEQISLKTELFGHELRVNAARLDEGIQVTIAGGSHSQIKYVTEFELTKVICSIRHHQFILELLWERVLVLSHKPPVIHLN